MCVHRLHRAGCNSTRSTHKAVRLDPKAESSSRNRVHVAGPLARSLCSRMQGIAIAFPNAGAASLWHFSCLKWVSRLGVLVFGRLFGMIIIIIIIILLFGRVVPGDVCGW